MLLELTLCPLCREGYLYDVRCPICVGAGAVTQVADCGLSESRVCVCRSGAITRCTVCAMEEAR